MEKIEGYLGALQSMKARVERYKNVKGIYDFYMFWVKRVFGWISEIEMDEAMRSYVQDHTRDYFDVIPSVCALHNKHDRLTYFVCKKDQTYSRVQYAINEYSNTIQGRVWRNVLNLLPAKS